MSCLKGVQRLYSNAIIIYKIFYSNLHMAVDNNQIVVGAFVGIVAFVVAWAAALVVSFLNNIFCII